MRCVLTDLQKLRLAIDYENGFQSGVLAKHYGVSDTTVRNVLREYGIVPTHVFKSRWELSYAQYLDDRGLDWEYEPRKFILDGYIYTPDFRVRVDRGIEYHEVKGWLDERTIRRLKAFVSKYPEETLRIIGPAEMVALGLAEEYYLKHKMADEVSSLRHQIEGDNHGQNNC